MALNGFFFFYKKMHNACRNQQDNGDAAENSTNFHYSCRLWLNLCNNIAQTWFFIALTFIRSLGRGGGLSKTEADTLGTLQILTHEHLSGPSGSGEG